MCAKCQTAKQVVTKRPRNSVWTHCIDARLKDFAFLAPCPSSGAFIHGSEDEVVPPHALSRVLEKISIQKGELIKDIIINGADHFFNDHNSEMIESVGNYLDSRLDKDGNFIYNINK